MKHMRTVTRIFAGLLIFCMLLTSFAGCRKPQPEDPGSASGSEDANYRICVKTEGGMAVPDVTVTVQKDGTTVTVGKTDANGILALQLEEAEYTLTVSDLRPGFRAPEDPVVTGTEGGEQQILLKTAVIQEEAPASHTGYQVGDVMYDFTFQKDGSPVKLSELLETKKLVVLNFWATWCGPCRAEFPAIEEALGEYGSEVEVIAMSISDSNTACESFRQENGYSFAMLQEFGLYPKFEVFGGGAIPFTLFIDRYGVFVNYIAGAESDPEAWRKEFAGYLSDAYVQKPGQAVAAPDTSDNPSEAPKPDVQMPDSAKIEAAINAAGMQASYSGPMTDTIWPWVLGDDQKSIKPANIGKHSTTAMISTEITFAEGQVLALDYRCSIERDRASVYDYDLLTVYVDGYRQHTVYGRQDRYTTLYVFTPEKAGTHTVTLVYSKDDSDTYLPQNEEFLEITNLRFVDQKAMTAAGGSMLLYRHAASGINPAEDPKTSYLQYAKVVLNKEDGYYHVGSATGPILLCDLMGSTAWASESLNDLAYGGYLVIGGVDYSERITEYTWQQTHSSLPYAPVDRTLADMLDLVASSIGEGPNHEDEWLEFCGYYDHYGVGEGVTKVFDVRQGISVDSAFPAKEGRNHVVMDQVLVPRGLFYEFAPKKSGVYSFYSVNPGPGEEDTIDTYAWLALPDGTLRGRIVEENDTGKSDENFCINYYCEAGKKYYIIVAFNAPDVLGEFDFCIEWLDERYDDFTACTRHYTTNAEGSLILVDRLYGMHAALGSDQYYHQVLSYAPDGSPILDESETGYVYVDFEGISVFTSYLMYDGEFVSLKQYIEMNGKIPDFGFDFTDRVDADGNSLSHLGNYQPQMEAYLAKMQKDGVEKGFVKADKTLVEILNRTLIALYGEYNGSEPVEDQWLMFCNFYRHLG